MRRDELPLPAPPSTDRPGDRWMCGRASDQSPCSRGPSASGACPLADACRPQRTWHGRRKQIALVALVGVIAATFVMTRSSIHGDDHQAGRAGNSARANIGGNVDVTALRIVSSAGCHISAKLVLGGRGGSCRSQPIRSLSGLSSHHDPATVREARSQPAAERSCQIATRFGNLCGTVMARSDAGAGCRSRERPMQCLPSRTPWRGRRPAGGFRRAMSKLSLGSLRQLCHVTS